MRATSEELLRSSVGKQICVTCFVRSARGVLLRSAHFIRGSRGEGSSFFLPWRRVCCAHFLCLLIYSARGCIILRRRDLPDVARLSLCIAILDRKLANHGSYLSSLGRRLPGSVACTQSDTSSTIAPYTSRDVVAGLSGPRAPLFIQRHINLPPVSAHPPLPSCGCRRGDGGGATALTP